MTWDWVQAAHAIPGRTRLRTPVLRTSRELVEQVAEALAAVPGVHEVRARPYTGSILIEHDPEVSHRAVLEAARRALGVERSIDLGEAAPRSTKIPELSRIARMAAKAVQEIDRDVRRRSSGSFDLGTLLALGFVGAGAIEVAMEREVEMPQWFTLAWWAFHMFITSEQAEIKAESVED